MLHRKRLVRALVRQPDQAELAGLQANRGWSLGSEAGWRRIGECGLNCGVKQRLRGGGSDFSKREKAERREASDKILEAYYVGDPNDQAAIDAFDDSVERAKQLLGKSSEKLESTTSRLWAYGKGENATHGYGEIQRDFRAPTQDQEVATAQRVASRLAAREVEGTPTRLLVCLHSFTLTFLPTKLVFG